MSGSVVPSADAFFLHIERTGAAQHVGGIVMLEPTDRRPTIEEVRALVGAGFARLPRMRQRLGPPSRWRRPRWVEADQVDLDWHVIEHRSTDGEAGLLRFVGELAEQPMPRDRPLWRIALVRDVAAGVAAAGVDGAGAAARSGGAGGAGGGGFGGGAGGCDALVVLVHHAIADGIGTVLQTFSLFEPRVGLDFPAGGGVGRIGRAAAVAVGLAQLATDGTAAKLPGGSARREFSVADLPLEKVRRIAAARGVRVTDLLIAALADGLHAVGKDLPATLRFSVTTMVRTPDSAAEGNATGAIIVEVPVDGRPFDDLLTEVSARTERLRRPTRALASRFVMATGLRVVPEPFAQWFARTVYGPRFLHAVVSNMPGTTAKLTFAGVQHRLAYPILPLVPGTPLAVGALSWAGVLGIGLASDPRLVDGAALAARVARTLTLMSDASGTGPFEGEEEASA
ncbi:wax ester/triacylglycerol synthase family O-acyltransferase [Kribbella solani]|uniref:wax ester/triacylglycerol synthase domain-containing protein n=3 Tax=Kribbella solani TaxID=236067 RepID=UPI0029B46CBF|nr:wax ester/triacylglycerol synthase domain-containing protein [Kribbella solani]MDX3006198.1 wax ester/triacylglycerol synthase family O-acyltransferase [Kribbella solani]